ncbi:MAG: radical SAM protein [Gemmatimonadales bacterium]
MASRTNFQLGLALESVRRELPVLDQRSRGTRFRALSVRQVLNSPTTTHMEFWSLNPYVGCEFGCSYCYARKTHQWVMEKTAGRQDGGTAGEVTGRQDGRTAGESEIGQPPALPADLPTCRPATSSAWSAFEHEILVKRTAPDLLLRTLDPEKLRGSELVIGTATDPYQPAERQFLLTRRVLEALLRFEGLSIGIITKSPLIARDLDVLSGLGRKHQLAVNISLASTDAALLRRLEARTPAPHARLRALARLTRAGIPAGLLIAPILPGITDGWASLAALMEAARAAGACFVHGAPLRLGPAAREGFWPVLEREFPELVARYRRRYGPHVNAGKDYGRALQRRLRSLRVAYGFEKEKREQGTALSQQSSVIRQQSSVIRHQLTTED